MCRSPASARRRALGIDNFGQALDHFLFNARKVASREPQSCSIAALTLREVVRGPGVSRSASPVSDEPRTKGSAMRWSLAGHAFNNRVDKG